MNAIEKVGNVNIDYAAVLNTLKLNPKDPNVQALILVCQQYELDPVLKHMVLIQGAAYITHKGLWHMAHRSGLLDGEDIIEQGETDKEWWAKVAIYRKDWARPITMTGRYPKSATNKQYGPEMAVTRAECLVLRRMFDVAVPVQEEINWSEDRGAGFSHREAETATATPQQARPTPPIPIDTVTGEIKTVKDAAKAQAKTSRRFAPPSTSAANTTRIMGEFAAADQLKALKARIAALTEWDKEALGEAWKAAGLPSVAGTGAKLTDEQLETADALVAAIETTEQ